MRIKRKGIVVAVVIGAAVMLGAAAAGAQPATPFGFGHDAGAARALGQAPAFALGTAFNYQGQLKNGGAPVNANCDFQFALYDALALGARVGTTQTVSSVAVANGLFSTAIDFGTGAFNGEARFLNIEVRCPAGGGTYTALGPRQALTPAPMALALPGLWTEQNATSPNLIGGFSGNSVVTTSSGSAVLSGGSAGNLNSVDGTHSVVAGGSHNNINSSDDSFIGGGFSNTITSHEGTIAGGGGNIIGGDHGVIVGGTQNQALGDDSFIGGGNKNVTTVAANNAVVAGGFLNIAAGPYSVIPGGDQNQTFGYYSFAGGLGARALANGDFVWADSVGVPFTSTANDQFIVRAAGGVGFGTNAPATQLHVVKSANGTATNPADNVVIFENPNTNNSADVLALKIGSVVTPAMSNNFITFLNGNNNSVGAIQGNNAGSVELAGAGNDYAEWLPRLDPAENIRAGDIVGVINGHITKDTRAAPQVMVVSTSPIVVGNDPGEQARAAYERVAFIGQVSVRVRGAVRAGDFIVPSGLGDGVGIAVAPEAITAEQYALAVGQAWVSMNELSVKLVRAAVGLARQDPTLARLVEKNQAQGEQLAAIEARLSALEHAPAAADTTPATALLWLLIGGIMPVGIWLMRRFAGGGKP